MADSNTTVKRWLGYLPHIFFYIVIGIMIGARDVLSGEFTTDRFRDPDFYSDLIILYAAAILTLLTTIDIWVSKYVTKEPRVKQLEDGIRYMLDKEVKGDFPVFMTEYNMKRKEKEYIEHVNDLIEKLDKKFGNKADNKWIYYKGTQEQKDNCHYCKELAVLEEMKSPKHVRDAVLYTNFKYDKIPDSFVKTGTRQNKQTVHGITIEKRSVKLARDLAPRLILSLTWSLFATSFLFTVTEFSWAAVYSVSMKLLIVAWNFFWAIHYVTYSYGPDKILLDLQMRRDLIEQYTDWKKGGTKHVNTYNRGESSGAGERIGGTQNLRLEHG